MMSTRWETEISTHGHRYKPVQLALVQGSLNCGQNCKKVVVAAASDWANMVLKNWVQTCLYFCSKGRERKGALGAANWDELKVDFLNGLKSQADFAGYRPVLTWFRSVLLLPSRFCVNPCLPPTTQTSALFWPLRPLLHMPDDPLDIWHWPLPRRGAQMPVDEGRRAGHHTRCHTPFSPDCSDIAQG